MTFNKKIDRLESGTATPKSPNDEVIWIDTNTNTMNRYDEINDSWVSVGDTGVPLTGQVFVDFLRTDTYDEDGTRSYPFKTLGSAYSAAVTLKQSTAADSVHINLLSGNTASTIESLQANVGHIFITGENSSGTHTPIVFYGGINFIGPNASISENHFGISNIEIIGITPVTFSGTYPQRLFLKDVWITATGNGDGMAMNNTGTGSTVHAHDCKFSHNGSNATYHCITVNYGTANLDGIETSGANVGVIGVNGGTCNLINSDIQAGGSYAIDVYAGGTLTAGNCKIATTAANSSGIKLVAAGAIAVVGNLTFSVPAAGTGRAIEGVSGSYLYYGPAYFLPDGIGGTTNRKINPAITAAAINSTPSFA